MARPKDKEDLALTLGGRKRKVRRADFDQLAMSLGISEHVRDNIYKEFVRELKRVPYWIDRSFLTDNYKETYSSILEKKIDQLGLI